MNEDVIRRIIAYLQMQASCWEERITANNYRINSDNFDTATKERARRMKEHETVELERFQSWIEELERSINEYTTHS